MKLAMVYHNTFAFKEARVAFEEAFIAQLRVTEAYEASEAEYAPAPHPLRLNFANPVTLDPAYTADAFSGAIIDQLFSGLLQRSVDGAIPDLAQSWELLDHGRRYVFRLRSDVYWSDGRPVTAADFEGAWKRALGGPSGDQPATLFYDIKGARAFNEGRAPAESVGVKARSDLELEVVMESPTSYFLELMASAATRPVPAHAVHAHGDAWTESENLVTNGPFKLTGWKRGDWLTLERNPAYHGDFGGNVERVKLYFDSASSENLIRKYDADELDVYYPNFAIASAYDWARQRHPNEYMSIPALGTLYLGFNVARAPFDDWRVRRAFALAIDRENLADENRKGIDFPAMCWPLPREHRSLSSSPFAPDRNPTIFGHRNRSLWRRWSVIRERNLSKERPRIMRTFWRVNYGGILSIGFTSKPFSCRLLHLTFTLYDIL